ncbi:hypothetical protein PInf_024597 [Phytophthora infestans]|nr:hypothetical protein PInf_024597 [Phytophthora infestans]
MGFKDNGTVALGHQREWHLPPKQNAYMDWEIHMAAYLDWVTYTVEWVMGDSGYVRWEVENQVIFEIPADSITNPPQDTAQMNPKKIMIEEPSPGILATKRWLRKLSR